MRSRGPVLAGAIGADDQSLVGSRALCRSAHRVPLGVRQDVLVVRVQVSVGPAPSMRRVLAQPLAESARCPVSRSSFQFDTCMRLEHADHDDDQVDRDGSPFAGGNDRRHGAASLRRSDQPRADNYDTRPCGSALRRCSSAMSFIDMLISALALADFGGPAGP